MRPRPGEQGMMFPETKCLADGSAGAVHAGTLEQLHRLKLWRVWDVGKPTVLIVMLNPSLADAMNDDPTLRKCIGFAKRWGMGRLLVGNLYTVVSPYPGMCREPFAQAPGADEALHEMAVEADMIVAAWGTQPWLETRPQVVRDLLERHKQLRCIGRTKDGQPRHPLYRSYEAALEPYV